jgi:hypothetical protein
MKQIYHHYLKWEEHHAGMWQKVGKVNADLLLKDAIEFMGNHKLYGQWMMKVVDEWPISCEQNLSDNSINKRAWIGHAACCLAINCPEYITRMAWHFLSLEQQDKANKEADKAILSWERRQCQKLLWE